jgi:hypothetical protein
MLQILTNQHQLGFGFTFPLIILNRETLAAKVEDVAIRTLIKPENAFSAKNIGWQLII